MLSVITSFKDLIAAVFDAIFSTIRSAIDKLCWFLIAAFMSFIAGIPRMMLHMVKGISEAIGGLGGFITSKSLYPLIIRRFTTLTLSAKMQHRHCCNYSRRCLWISGAPTARATDQGKTGSWTRQWMEGWLCWGIIKTLQANLECKVPHSMDECIFTCPTDPAIIWAISDV